MLLILLTTDFEKYIPQGVLLTRLSSFKCNALGYKCSQRINLKNIVQIGYTISKISICKVTHFLVFHFFDAKCKWNLKKSRRKNIFKLVNAEGSRNYWLTMNRTEDIVITDNMISDLHCNSFCIVLILINMLYYPFMRQYVRSLI